MRFNHQTVAKRHYIDVIDAPVTFIKLLQEYEVSQISFGRVAQLVRAPR